MADHSSKECMSHDGLKRRRDELAAIQCLYDLSIGHVSEDSLGTIMDEVLGAAISLSHADMGNIQLLDNQSGMLKLQVHTGLRPEFLDFFAGVHAGHEAGCGMALMKRQRVVVEDVAQSPVFAGTPAHDILLAAGVRAGQSTPMISRTGRLVGVFFTYYRKPCREEAMGLGYIDLLARQAADIIEQVQIHQALQESNRKISDILESITDAFYAVSADWRLTYINNRCEQWWQGSREELVGRVLWDMFPNYEAAQGYQEHIRAMNERKSVQFETFSSTLGAWVEVSIYPSAEGGLSVYFRDISERKQLEELLARQSEDRFQKIFRDSPSMIAIVSMSDDTYVEANKKFLDTIGYTREEVLGHTAAELKIRVMENDFLEPFLIICREGGEVQNTEFNLRTKSGSIITVLASIAPITFNGELCRIAMMQNITKEKMLEADLLRLDRLNLVGEMAASIGHEVRNPLTTVRGYLQLMQRKAEIFNYQGQITTMIEELDRANTIISDFLSLAKNKVVELKCDNLNTIISILLPMLQSEAYRTGHDIEFDRGEVPDIELDEKEIRQLLLNLVRNGFDAMESGGKLTIRTCVNRDAVLLVVSDTGGGIPKSVLAKLGTPFLTTKENGTGLGLPVCYRIAERHGAKIDVQTSPAGTTFHVYFRGS